MDNLLPCPFCGSPGILEPQDDNFVRCGSIVRCAGTHWFRVDEWQNRKINHADAFNQYVESLKSDRRLIASLIRIIPAAINVVSEVKYLGIRGSALDAAIQLGERLTEFKKGQ